MEKNIDWENIKRNIKSVGMSTFVNYYYDFQKLTYQELLEKFKKNEKKWNDNSRRTKAFSGKLIFSENNQKVTLELIISSKSDEKTIQKATEIYLNEYPNSEIKTIRFIRPEFEFGKEIIEKLFNGYEIISQYEVCGYKLDWYIPELKLVIEFDENHHKRQEKEDKLRQSKIEKKLQCTFLRYKY